MKISRIAKEQYLAVGNVYNYQRKQIFLKLYTTTKENNTVEHVHNYKNKTNSSSWHMHSYKGKLTVLETCITTKDK